MKKPKSISFILSVPKGERIPSVNNTYKAQLKYVHGKPVPVIYKSGEVKKVMQALDEQLKLIDFSKESWIYEKNAVFDLDVQTIVNRDIFRLDADNQLKAIMDCLFRHLGLNDSRVLKVTNTKSMCKTLETEKICVCLSQSTKEIHFDKLEELPVPSRIFLGGTCNHTTWRGELIPELEKLGYEYFNPIVPDWTPECIQIENDEKENKCDCHLYIITPQMTGVYSIAEIINSAHETKQMGTGCCLFGLMGTREEFGEGQWRSLQNVLQMTNKISNGSKKIWAGEIKKPSDILEHLGVPKKKRKKKEG